MKYLVPIKKKSKAHLWDEEKQDSVCRMWSTGGLKKSSYSLGDNTSRQICSLCLGGKSEPITLAEVSKEFLGELQVAYDKRHLSDYWLGYSEAMSFAVEHLTKIGTFKDIKDDDFKAS